MTTIKISRAGIQLPFYTTGVVVNDEKSQKRNRSDNNGPSPDENLPKSPLRVASAPTLTSICLSSGRNSRVPLKKRMKRSESSMFTLREPRDLKPKPDGTSTVVKPEECVERIIQKSGISMRSMNVDSEYFLPIEKQQHSSYPQAALAARNEDLPLLKKLHEEGHNLQCSNKFGESIIHIICRRGRDDILDFLVSEVDVSLRLRDDLGRTPLHDAAWSVCHINNWEGAYAIRISHSFLSSMTGLSGLISK
jgi:hypothetical protein